MDLEEITRPVTLRNPRNLLAVTTAVGWVVPTPLALSLLWASDPPRWAFLGSGLSDLGLLTWLLMLLQIHGSHTVLGKPNNSATWWHPML